jgi:hypothetical protein
MKKIMTIFGAILFASTFLSSCGQSGPAACECVEQFNYYHQDGGMFKLDQDKINSCVDKFKDKNANVYPEDINSAEKNARQKCDK